MIELTDDLSRAIRFEAPPRRIVSLVPSITETLFTLGVGPSIVGITDYCIHPASEVAAKTRVGGTRNFHPERIFALQPDLVIANAEENPRRQVEKLEEGGVRVFITFPRSVDGCLAMIASLAALTGAEQAAKPILAAIEKARTDARAGAGAPPPRVLCPIWKDPYMTINGDTYIDSVIRSCGGRNIFEDRSDRYPEFTLAEAARLQPDIVLLPTEPYHFAEADIAEFNSMGAEVPAVRSRRMHIVEGELLSWYGPRLSRALGEISALTK